MTSDSHEPRLPIATVSTNSRGALPDVFHCSVHVVDLARASLSRRFESVQCLLARDDTASVNLYLDQRKELDYLSFRLTRNIRQLYTNGPTHTVKVQLSSQQQRLDITLATGTLCQAIYDQLQQDEPTADEYEHFPMIRPKVGLLKPDPTAAYLTASDMPVDSKELVISSAPKRKQIVVQSSRPEPDQSNKKSRIYPIPGRSTYRPSREAVDPILSSEICDYDDSSELWTLASSPPDPHHEEMLTRSLSATRRPLDRSEGSGYSRPNAVPSRVLQPRPDLIRRYGHDGKARKTRQGVDREGSKCVKSILQALFSLSPIMDDFRRRSRIASTIGFDGLYRSLTHSFSQCSENRLMKLEDYETVVERVVKIGKGSLGDDEDDAREFLGDLLNQLRKEDRETMDQKCPLSHLFECAIDNFLRCPNCGHESVHTEQHHDLRLEVPSQDINRSSQRPLSIGSLILEVFDAQQIFYECESCQYQSAEVHRTVSKLPTVLVLYLKRFTPRPTQRSRKNRSLVSIDGLLDVGLFCTPTALSLTAQEDLISLSQSMDEERMNLHPQIPSDSFPSSSSSRFSSVSPRKRMDSLSTDGFGVGSLLYDSFESTYSNPIELYSEDENLYDPTPEQSFSVYESTCEEEQIRWAIEESIRASQSSLNAVDDSWIEQSLDEAASSPHAYTNSGSLIFNGMSHDDEDSNGFHVENHNAINTNGKETAYDKEENGDSAPYEILSSQESVTVKTEEQLTAPVASTARSPIVIEDDEDDEDPELKAAILASLNPKEASVETTTATEKDLLEQENRDIEEAIKRSLVDLEENKENISPDEPKDGKKKGKHGKKPSVGTLTRSHSQIYSLSQPTSTATLSISTTKTEPTIPRLIRAHTIEGEGSWRYELRSKTRTGVEPAMIDHPIRSTSSPTPPRTPTTKLAGIPSRPESKTRVPPPSPIELQRHRSTTKPGLATTPTTSTTAAATTSKPGRMTRSQKGKEKAWIEQETADEKLGHFRLQATVSHTGLVSPTPGDRGRYVCDSLGPDGVWRSHDENGVMSKIGSLADLCQKRGRSGYMFFYVRTQTTTTAAGL